MEYRVVLFSHLGHEIAAREEITSLRAAKEQAAYMLSDRYEEVAESTHERMETRKVEVRDAEGECVWDKFHPLSHDQLSPKILSEITGKNSAMKLEDLGTTGLVDYVLGGSKSTYVACMSWRKADVERVLAERNSEEIIPTFHKAVEAERARRGNAIASYERKTDGTTYFYNGQSIISAPTMIDGGYEGDANAHCDIADFYSDPYNEPLKADELREIFYKLDQHTPSFEALKKNLFAMAEKREKADRALQSSRPFKNDAPLPIKTNGRYVLAGRKAGAWVEIDSTGVKAGETPSDVIEFLKEVERGTPAFGRYDETRVLSAAEFAKLSSKTAARVANDAPLPTPKASTGVKTSKKA